MPAPTPFRPAMIGWQSWAVAVAVGVLSLWAAGRAIPYLRRHGVLDHPNARSSHRVAIPRGGGLVVVAAALMGWAALGAAGIAIAPWPVMAAAAGLALVGFLDDRRGLAVAWRLGAQAVAVGVGLAHGPLLPGGILPMPVEVALLGLAWLWFVNLFNFMDGIDGLAGSEAVAIAFGLAWVLGAIGTAGAAALALVVAAAALGFLRWNWAPARVFLGDAGSVPLGYLLGWLLLGAVASGAWAAALILPAYFVADATLTLLGRLVRGASPWRAHAEHVYQQSVRGGRSHGTVAATVALANVGLIGLARLSLDGTAALATALVAAAVGVAGLLWYLRRPLSGRAARPDDGD